MQRAAHHPSRTAATSPGTAPAATASGIDGAVPTAQNAPVTPGPAEAAVRRAARTGRTAADSGMPVTGPTPQRTTATPGPVEATVQRAETPQPLAADTTTVTAPTAPRGIAGVTANNAPQPRADLGSAPAKSSGTTPDHRPTPGSTATPVPSPGRTAAPAPAPAPAGEGWD
ncbi:hypothetical protein [Streptomyces scabiei]|uniref:hypothetical protein n=1 Tax=Streptomyces scabiei TaxID=1930 RepID=UPI0029BC6A0F|nr:hypothetical protein [Streptomyces scabiei]MDX3035312.1 hypothetical protein [Streptomyces scabiei]